MTTVLWLHNILRTVRFKNTPPSPEGTVAAYVHIGAKSCRWKSSVLHRRLGAGVELPPLLSRMIVHPMRLGKVPLGR